MDYVAAHDNRDGGFSLWLESDMVPVKRDWLDRLDAEWRQAADVWVMGRYVPNVPKRLIVRRKRLWIDEHINGGACYAKAFARLVPKEYRRGTFDVAIYPYVKHNDRTRRTEAIAFSTVEDCRRDAADARYAVLHGFLQNKEEFLNRCLMPLPNETTTREARWQVPFWLRCWKSLRLSFYWHRQRALLEALLYEQSLLAAREALAQRPLATVPSRRKAA
jgi:hypothetical protein